jgi:hypothetical protein
VSQGGVDVPCVKNFGDDRLELVPAAPARPMGQKLTPVVFNASARPRTKFRWGFDLI